MIPSNTAPRKIGEIRHKDATGALIKENNRKTGSCYKINSSRNLTFSELHHSTIFLNLSTPDDLLAEVAIGPLSAQETGLQQKSSVLKIVSASANTLLQKKTFANSRPISLELMLMLGLVLFFSCPGQLNR